MGIPQCHASLAMFTPWLERRVGQLVFVPFLLRWFAGIHHHGCVWGTSLSQLSLELFDSTVQRLDFIDLSGRVTQSRNETNWSQTLRGSVRYDEPTNDVQFKRRSGVGFGAAVVRPCEDVRGLRRHITKSHIHI